MTNIQAGSRWEVPLAVRRTLQANLQGHVDVESARLAEVFGELSGDDYEGDAVMLRIPDVVSVRSKMDPSAYPLSTDCPAVYVGGLGETKFMPATSTIPQQSMARTPVNVTAYVTTRAVYQGIVHRLTEEELIIVAGALGGAIIRTLQAVGTGSLWSQQAGIINPNVLGMGLSGHATDDGKTSAIKISIAVQMGHEMGY